MPTIQPHPNVPPVGQPGLITVIIPLLPIERVNNFYYPFSGQMSSTDRPLIMELVNRTLMEFELKKADLAGVPSKSLIWFGYGNLKPVPTDRENKRKYEDFKWRLRYEHRDVTFFMANLNQDSIKNLLRRDEDWIQVGQGTDVAAENGRDLANKICQTPQVFQYNECRVKKSEERLYEGLLTLGHKQYWAMYPEYFIKSYNIDLKVIYLTIIWKIILILIIIFSPKQRKPKLRSVSTDI